MSENVQITPGTGNTVAADEVTDGTLGTAKVQYVKIMDGTIAGTSKAAVGANGLKVDGSGVTQPVSGTVTVNPLTNSSIVKAQVQDNSGSGITSTSNALDVNLKSSGVTQSVSGTVTSNQGTPGSLTAGWPVIGGIVTESTAAWTSSTTLNSTLAITVNGYNHVFITLNQTSTITGGVITFEISDTVAFTNAYPINAIQINNAANVATTYTLTASTNQAFYINAAGAAAIRVRLSTVISGTGTVNVGIQANANGGDPIIGGVVDAQLLDGAGNNITSQANGAQRALDVGIDVGGTQIDPRLIQGSVTTNPPTYSTGTNQPLSLSPAGGLRVEQLLSTRQHYGAATTAFTPPATPTDVFTITGSATKTVRVSRIELSTTQSTAGVNTWFIIKRSAADTGGTSTTLTLVPLDANNGAATAVVVNYTANPTALGAAVGTLRTTRILSDATTTTAQSAYIFDFTNSGISSGIVLRGTSQVLALNFGGAALPTGLSVACNIEWSEE